MTKLYNFRRDDDLPLCVEKWGWKYHHLGIPTQKKMPDERYLPHLKFYVSGFSKSPFGVEWMRFDEDCPVAELIKSLPHIAFEVENIDVELKKHNFKILAKPGIPSDGVRSAMIEHNGAPIELIEFHR